MFLSYIQPPPPPLIQYLMSKLHPKPSSSCWYYPPSTVSHPSLHQPLEFYLSYINIPLHPFYISWILLIGIPFFNTIHHDPWITYFKLWLFMIFRKIENLENPNIENLKHLQNSGTFTLTETFINILKLYVEKIYAGLLYF